MFTKLMYIPVQGVLQYQRHLILRCREQDLVFPDVLQYIYNTNRNLSYPSWVSISLLSVVFDLRRLTYQAAAGNLSIDSITYCKAVKCYSYISLTPYT